MMKIGEMNSCFFFYLLFHIVESKNAITAAVALCAAGGFISIASRLTLSSEMDEVADHTDVIHSNPVLNVV